MNFRFRRMGDGIAGAVIATVVLAGGAAYAASGVIDDHPHADLHVAGTVPAVAPTSTLADDHARDTAPTSTVDDHRGAGEARREDAAPSSTPSTTSSTTTVAPGVAPAARDRGDDRDDADDDHGVDGAGHDVGDDHGGNRRDGRPTTTLALPATPIVRTVQSAGGSVTVRQSGDRIELVAAIPNAGWTASVKTSGPERVEVRFTNGAHESRVEISRQDGAARDRVEDR